MEFITLSKMKKILRKQEVTKMNGATSSEGDAKSIDDSKSNCESDDGNLFSCGSFCSFFFYAHNFFCFIKRSKKIIL